MKATPKNAHMGQEFRWSTILKPWTAVQVAWCSLSELQRFSWRHLVNFLSTLKHARKTAKPPRIAAWGWTVVCFFLLNCLGTLKNIPSSQLSQFVACGFYSKKWTFPPKEPWNFSPSSSEDLLHCCFHTLLKRWSFCFVNRTTFFSRVFRGFISETIFFTEKKIHGWWVVYENLCTKYCTNRYPNHSYIRFLDIILGGSL